MSWLLLAVAWLMATDVQCQAIARPDKRYPAFSREEYRSRCSRLMDRIPDGVALFRGAPLPTGDSQFYQFNNLAYFTGLEVPGIILAIDGKSRKVILFLTIREEEASAEGIPLDLIRDPQRFSGADSVFPVNRFTSWLEEAVGKGAILYAPFRSEELQAEVSSEKSAALKKSMTLDEWDGRLIRELQFAEKLKERFTGLEVRDSWAIVSDLRKIKSDEEIAVMREAGRIGIAAHKALIRETRVGVTEAHLANVFEFACKEEGAEGLAYNTIIMSAENIPYGHYHRYNRTLADGDFVVLDAGPDYRHYDVDFSTSFPASGKFTQTQKELYDLANGIRLVCVNAYKPGITFRQVGQQVRNYLAENGYNPEEARFRGLINYGGYNHSVGMAVHDGMGSFRGPDEVLQPGFVFACDINMMYADLEIGIRLEDTVVVTAAGCEVLSEGLPRTTLELETFMSKNYE